MIIGAQMYTVRDFCKTTDGIAETLKKIADIGYKTVQVSGVCDFDPKWLKNELDKNGLKCVVTHLDREKIANNTQEIIDAHKALDCKNIGIGWYELHKQGVDSFYEHYINAAKMIESEGFTLTYHNHDHEFTQNAQGITLLQELADRFTPEQLNFTIDTFWAQAGGADPAALIEHLAGRCKCVHLKDMAYDRIMRPVGSGNMNFPRIIEACEKAGSEFLLVEQDKSYDEDPFCCLKTSYDYLTSLGLK